MGPGPGHRRHLAWRIRKNLVFVPLQVLPGGSYLSVMPTPKETVRHGQARAAGRRLVEPPQGHTVRIIQNTVTVRPRVGLPHTETFRLVTRLLDHRLAPARQLAMTYHERWEIEIGFAELKNRLRGSGFILRSKAPELICQEIYALLTVYQALCALEIRAAEQAGIDPDRISFTVTVELARLKVASQAATDATTLDATRRGRDGDPGRAPPNPTQPAVPAHQEADQEHFRGQETRPAPHAE